MEFLEHLPNLETIDARACGISTINFNYLFHLDKVYTTDFSHNTIGSIEKYCFFAMRNGLRTLNLSNNVITNFAKETFYDLSKLEVLDLSNNLITNIQPTSFEDLHQLRELNFAKNQLQILHFQRFSKNQNLQILIVSTNNINNITFPEMVWKNLTTLDLSNNMIYQMGPNNASQHLPNLENLIFSKMFAKTEDLKKLIEKSELISKYVISYVAILTISELYILAQLYCMLK
jgi:Leucine-rich repeat (LRR) protein